MHQFVILGQLGVLSRCEIITNAEDSLQYSSHLSFVNSHHSVWQHDCFIITS